MKILPNGIAVLENDTHASRHVEQMGTLFYEAMIRRDVMPLIKPGDHCVDGGALIGAYSRGMKDAAGPGGRVISFEPNPEAFECLKRNCPDCEYNCSALGASAGAVSLVLQENAGGTYCGDTALGGLIRPRIALDDLKLQRLDFLKLDVEGMEVQALAGAIRTIILCRPIIYLELNHACLARYNASYANILLMLGGLGYRYKFPDPKHSLREREWSQPDVIFFP